MKRFLLSLAVAIVCVAALCVFSVDPNSGLFSCKTTKDCGSGYECVPQAAGGALCYPVGVCTGACNDPRCPGQVCDAGPVCILVDAGLDGGSDGGVDAGVDAGDGGGADAGGLDGGPDGGDAGELDAGAVDAGDAGPLDGGSDGGVDGGIDAGATCP